MVAARNRVPVLQRPATWKDHVAFAVIILVVWQVCSAIFGALTLPGIQNIFLAFVDMVSNGELPTAFFQSLTLLVAGLAAAMALGFVFGTLIGRSQLAHFTLSPYFSALFVTPTVALVPLVLVLFGFGFTGRVIVVVLAALVPVLLAVSTSLRDDPGELVEVARSFGVKGEISLLRTVRLRAALPVILSGMRLAVGRAVVGMAVAETYLRLGGMGGLIKAYGALFRTDYVWAAILPLSAMGILLTFAVRLVERRYEGWR